MSVKATVKRISGIKKLHLDGEVVDKRELTVADPTGGIKVLLWGNACETEILTGKTYLKAFVFDLTIMAIT